MLRIGLTGGIASGKSFVAAELARLGADVVDTDQVAREVVEPGSPGLARVIGEFGEEFLLSDGRLDRRMLRDRVFSDAAGRRRLEAILHPLIRQRTLQKVSHSTGPYVVIVVPLLVETGFAALVDRVLVIDCQPGQQLARLIGRDQLDPETAKAMLASQVGRAERLAAADDVLDNSGTVEATREQAGRLHEQYLALAGSLP